MCQLSSQCALLEQKLADAEKSLLREKEEREKHTQVRMNDGRYPFSMSIFVVVDLFILI